MEKLISLKELIKAAKDENINLGKGDPYNRLRYYTKMEWLPHMIRKVNSKGEIEGHYPAWTLDILKQIHQFKIQGLSNEQIDEKIRVQNNIQKTLSNIVNKDNQQRIILYILGVAIVIILLSELNILNIGKSKSFNTLNNIDKPINTIIDSGTGMLPEGTSKIFVKTNFITSTSKINITFKENYSPINRYWVSNIDNEKGFYLETDVPSSDVLTFYWFVSK